MGPSYEFRQSTALMACARFSHRAARRVPVVIEELLMVIVKEIALAVDRN